MANETMGVIYKQEAEKFMGKLFKFHQQNGTPLRRVPTLGGRELDLYHLYEKVKALGGSAAVSHNRMWGEVARSFNLPPSVTSASYAIRQHYTKLLESFEAYESDPNFIDFFHSSSTPSQPSHPLTITHTPSQPRLSRPQPSTLTPSLPHTSASKPVRSATSGSISSVKCVRGCERLVRSLMSGFPNEVDFAFNILTIMSKNETLPIVELPHLLDVMLAHVAVFSEDDYGLETVYHESWHKDSDTDYHQFWEESVPVWIHDVLFSYYARKAPSLPALFSSKCLPSESDVECYRVCQLLTILRNLSFTDKCALSLSRHEGLLRFLLLCINNIVPDVRSLSLDLLTNLAPHILLNSHSSLVELLMASVNYCILSRDKLQILRGLETLGELGWCVENELILSETPQEVYNRLFELLLLSDVHLVLTTIDTLYNLSFYGGEIASNIAAVDKCFEILIDLLGLKIESFGSDALARVKVIEASTPKQVPQQQLISQLLNLQGIQLATSGGVSSATKRGASDSSTPVLVTNPNSKLVVGNPIQGFNIGTKNRTLTQINKLQTHSLKIGNSVIPILSSKSPLLSATSGNHLSSLPAATLTEKQLQDLLVKRVPTVSSSQPVNLINLIGLNSSTPSSQTPTSKTTPKTNTSTPSRNNFATVTNLSNAIKTLMAAKAAEHRRQNTPSPTEALNERTTSSTGSQTTTAGLNKVNGSTSVSGRSTPTSVEGVASSPQPAAATPHSSSERMTGSESAKQVKNKAEEFAGVWLKTYYKTVAQKYINLGDMHSLYILACSECGHKDPLTVGQFESRVRKVFPSTSTSQVTLGNKVVTMVSGLERQLLPLSVLRPPLPATPTSMTLATPTSSSTSNGSVPSQQIMSKALTNDFSLLRKGRPLEDANDILKAKRIKLESETDKINLAASVAVTNSKISSSISVAKSSSPTLLVTGTNIESSENGTRINRSHSRERTPLEPGAVDKLRGISPGAVDKLRGISPGSSVSTRDSTPPQSASSSSQQVSSQRSSPESFLNSSRSNSPWTGEDQPVLQKSSLAASSSSAVCHLECHWSSCTSVHASWNELLYHVVYDHLPSVTTYPTVCLWRNCSSKAKRMRPSLVRHLQTHHCTTDSKPSLSNVSATLSKLRNIQPFEKESESSLTKAVRLTAALVLRNLVVVLPEARRRLLAYESRLCQVSMSNSEASCAVSQCLYYLHHS